MKALVLGLGNDLLSDDGIGVIAARELRWELSGRAEVKETSRHGLALLDFVVGYKRLVIIDAVSTGRFSPGTILELDPNVFESVPGPSPHYTGLPELIKIASELELEFPQEIKVIAVEVMDLHSIGAELTESVANAVAEVKRRVKKQLRKWEEKTRAA